MLLSKEVAVNLNLAACKFKQYYAKQLRKRGITLTPEQLIVLDLLWNLGEMSQQKIADSTGKDKNSVTKLIDGLEAKGLVVRHRSDLDRRSYTIVLTQKAEEIKQNTKEFGIELLNRIMDGISEDELKVLIGTLTKMSNNMGRM